MAAVDRCDLAVAAVDRCDLAVAAAEGVVSRTVSQTFVCDLMTCVRRWFQIPLRGARDV